MNFLSITHCVSFWFFVFVVYIFLLNFLWCSLLSLYCSVCESNKLAMTTVLFFSDMCMKVILLGFFFLFFRILVCVHIKGCLIFFSWLLIYGYWDVSDMSTKMRGFSVYDFRRFYAFCSFFLCVFNCEGDGIFVSLSFLRLLGFPFFYATACWWFYMGGFRVLNWRLLMKKEGIKSVLTCCNIACLFLWKLYYLHYWVCLVVSMITWCFYNFFTAVGNIHFPYSLPSLFFWNFKLDYFDFIFWFPWACAHFGMTWFN